MRASKVARALLFVCQKRNIEVSNLKLQKLLYYSQAWSLALRKGPLFSEPIEAWVHGPVVPSVFREFRKFGRDPIDAAGEPLDDRQAMDHLEEVIEVYGAFSAYDLERMTHREEPWRKARGSMSPDTPGSTVITKKSMQEFYSRQLRD